MLRELPGLKTDRLLKEQVQNRTQAMQIITGAYFLAVLASPVQNGTTSTLIDKSA